MGSATDTGHGTDREVSELGEWRSNALRTITEHKAVTRHGKGIDTADLADFIKVISGLAADRVSGVGAEQYAGDVQSFENKDIDEIVTDLIEELLDIIAYTGFLAIKAGALR